MTVNRNIAALFLPGEYPGLRNGTRHPVFWSVEAYAGSRQYPVSPVVLSVTSDPGRPPPGSD